MAGSRIDLAEASSRLAQAHARLQSGDHDGALLLLTPLRGNDAAGIAASRLRGMIAFARNDIHDAARQFGRVARWPVSTPTDHVNLGLALLRLGRTDRAEKSLRFAIERDPDHAQAWFNLGALHLQTEAYDHAAEALERATVLAPQDARARYNLGLARAGQHRHRAAADEFRLALEHDPGLIDSWNNMGLAYEALGELDKAEAAYLRLLEIQPHHAPALANLGRLLMARRRFGEGYQRLDQAASLAPTDNAIQMSLAEALLRTSQTDRAKRTLRQILERDPEHGQALAALAMALQWECDWEPLEPLRERLRPLALNEARAGRQSPIAPHTALSQGYSPAEERLIAESWSRRTRDNMVREVTDNRFAYPERRRNRIRLGYFSNDFNSQATAHLIVGLFEHHDRAQFEVYAYSFGGDDGSIWRQRIEAASDAFVDVTDESYADTAARMNADEIDILLDFKGFTAEARPQVYALRPAPIQVNYLGYPGTIGADWLDYIVADEIVIPPDEQHHYTEAVAYLPDSYQANDDRQPIGGRPSTRSEAGLPDHGIVFSCFNETYKIDRTIFSVWMRILDRVPGSVLWLRDHNEQLRDNLRDYARRHGIDPDRLIFASAVPKQEHLARCRLADLFLDSYMLTAHTTATDSLWVGVPLLTCPRNTFATRVGKSLLTNLGLPELAVANLEEYEENAVALATNPVALAALKQKLQGNLKTEPLFDTARLTRHLESAFIQMWQRYQRGEPPAGFKVVRIDQSL